MCLFDLKRQERNEKDSQVSVQRRREPVTHSPSLWSSHLSCCPQRKGTNTGSCTTFLLQDLPYNLTQLFGTQHSCQGCIFCLTCSYPELTEDHVLTSAYVKIFRTVTRNAVNKSVWRKKDCFWLPLNKHAMNIWLSSLRIRAHLSWRTGKHLHVLHVLRTYSTCSYPGYQDTTTYAALVPDNVKSGNKCVVCDVEFEVEDSLDEHIRSIHKDVVKKTFSKEAFEMVMKSEDYTPVSYTHLRAHET